MKKLIKKKKKLLVVIALLLFSIPSVAGASGIMPTSINWDNEYGYAYIIKSITEGHNTLPQRKYPGYAYAVSYQTMNSLGNDIRTNYIIISATDIQVTTNVITTMNEPTGIMTYYSAAHDDMVRLRGNSGSGTVGYTVAGTWAPNAWDCGC